MKISIFFWNVVIISLLNFSTEDDGEELRKKMGKKDLSKRERKETLMIPEKAENLLLTGGTGKWFSSFGFSKTPVLHCYVRPWAKVKLSTASIKHELFSRNNILIKKEGGMYEEHDVHFVFPNRKNTGPQKISMLKCPCSLAFNGELSRLTSRKSTDLGSSRAASKKRIDSAGDPSIPSTSGTKSGEDLQPHFHASNSVKDHEIVSTDITHSSDRRTSRAEQLSTSESISETDGQPLRPFPEVGEETKIEKMKTRTSHHFEPYESRYDDEVGARAEEKNFITTFRDERPDAYEEGFNAKSRSSEQEIETQLESKREVAKQELLFRHISSEQEEEIQLVRKGKEETVKKKDVSASDDVHGKPHKESSHSASLENKSKVASVKTTLHNTSSSIYEGFKEKLMNTFKWKEKENTTVEQNFKSEKSDHPPSDRSELEKVGNDSSVSNREKEKIQTTGYAFVVESEKNNVPYSSENHESHQKSTDASRLKESHSQSSVTSEESKAEGIRVTHSENRNRESSLEYTERSDGRINLSTERTETSSSAALEKMKKNTDRSSAAERNISSKSVEIKQLKDSASEENTKAAAIESQNPPQESYFQAFKKRLWGSSSPVVEDKKQQSETRSTKAETSSQERKAGSSSEEHGKQEAVKPENPPQETYVQSMKNKFWGTLGYGTASDDKKHDTETISVNQVQAEARSEEKQEIQARSSSEEHEKHKETSQNPPQETYFQSLKKKVWGSPTPVPKEKNPQAETSPKASSPGLVGGFFGGLVGKFRGQPKTDVETKHSSSSSSEEGYDTSGKLVIVPATKTDSLSAEYQDILTMKRVLEEGKESAEFDIAKKNEDKDLSQEHSKNKSRSQSESHEGVLKEIEVTVIEKLADKSRSSSEERSLKEEHLVSPKAESDSIAFSLKIGAEEHEFVHKSPHVLDVHAEGDIVGEAQERSSSEETNKFTQAETMLENEEQETVKRMNSNSFQNTLSTIQEHEAHSSNTEEGSYNELLTSPRIKIESESTTLSRGLSFKSDEKNGDHVITEIKVGSSSEEERRASFLMLKQEEDYNHRGSSHTDVGLSESDHGGISEIIEAVVLQRSHSAKKETMKEEHKSSESKESLDRELEKEQLTIHLMSEERKLEKSKSKKEGNDLAERNSNSEQNIDEKEKEKKEKKEKKDKKDKDLDGNSESKSDTKESESDGNLEEKLKKKKEKKEKKKEKKKKLADGKSDEVEKNDEYYEKKRKKKEEKKEKKKKKKEKLEKEKLEMEKLEKEVKSGGSAEDEKKSKQEDDKEIISLDVKYEKEEKSESETVLEVQKSKVSEESEEQHLAEKISESFKNIGLLVTNRSSASEDDIRAQHEERMHEHIPENEDQDYGMQRNYEIETDNRSSRKNESKSNELQGNEKILIRKDDIEPNESGRDDTKEDISIKVEKLEVSSSEESIRLHEIEASSSDPTIRHVNFEDNQNTHHSLYRRSPEGEYEEKSPKPSTNRRDEANQEQGTSEKKLKDTESKGISQGKSKEPENQPDEGAAKTHKKLKDDKSEDEVKQDSETGNNKKRKIKRRRKEKVKLQIEINDYENIKEEEKLPKNKNKDSPRDVEKTSKKTSDDKINFEKEKKIKKEKSFIEDEEKIKKKKKKKVKSDPSELRVDNNEDELGDKNTAEGKKKEEEAEEEPKKTKESEDKKKVEDSVKMDPRKKELESTNNDETKLVIDIRENKLDGKEQVKMKISKKSDKDGSKNDDEKNVTKRKKKKKKKKSIPKDGEESEKTVKSEFKPDERSNDGELRKHRKKKSDDEKEEEAGHKGIKTRKIKEVKKDTMKFVTNQEEKEKEDRDSEEGNEKKAKEKKKSKTKKFTIEDGDDREIEGETEIKKRPDEKIKNESENKLELEGTEKKIREADNLDSDGKTKSTNDQVDDENAVENPRSSNEITTNHRLFRRSPAFEFSAEIPHYERANDVPAHSVCVSESGGSFVYFSKGLDDNNSFFVYGKAGNYFHVIAHLVLG